jgi:hypothetical protein
MHSTACEACKINMHPNLVVRASRHHFKGWRLFNAPLRRVTLSFQLWRDDDDRAHA